MALRLLANPAPRPHLNANHMAAYCDVINGVLWDTTKADDLIARAAWIVEEVAENNFDRDNIRTLPFTERVVARCRSGLSVPPPVPIGSSARLPVS